LPKEYYFEIFVKEYLKSNDIAHYKIYREELNFPETELNFPDTEIKIDPYIIGIWLGDGTEASAHITSADKEIVDYLREYFEDFGLIVNSKDIQHRIISRKKYGYPGKNLFLNYLRETNLLNNKHIPDFLLFTSRENRLRLLAGLLDSDGSLKNNCYDFIQKREKLFDQFVFLCRSLGFSCYKKQCIKICTNAPNGPTPGNYFRCNVSGQGLEEIPTLLNRKQAQIRKQIKRVYVNGFVLKDIGEMDYYRLITDNPLFLMSDFTVRHRYENEYNNKDKKIIYGQKEKMSSLPFGYKKINDKIGINEEEAKTVRLIFEEYYNNKTYNEIVEILKSKNMKTRTQIDWTSNTLSPILGYKDKYIGSLRNCIGSGDSIWPIILQDEKYKKDRTKKGNAIGGKIYGYTKIDKKLVIDEKEGNVVRFIFQERKKLVPNEKIAEKLNNTDIKPRMSQKWSTNIVRNIIKNQNKYEGIDETKWPIILKKET